MVDPLRCDEMKPQALFVAQPTYAAWPALTGAADSAKLLANELATGFELTKPELLEGGDKRPVEDALHDWFSGAAERAVLILHWPGHGPARLEQAVPAYRAALEEQTRERVPLAWANTQNNRALCTFVFYHIIMSVLDASDVVHK